MTRNNYIYNMVLASLLLLPVATACQSDEATTTGQTGSHAIQIDGVGVAPLSAVTRDASDAYNASLPEGKDIAVYMYDNGTTDFSTQKEKTDASYVTWVYQTASAPYAISGGRYQSSLSLVSHKKSPDFPKKSGSNSELVDKVTLFAMFPYDVALTPDKTNYTFTVPLSQTATQADQAAITAADLMTTDGLITYTKEQCDNKDQINLVLQHRMAKLRVAFTPKTGSDLTAGNMPTKFDVIGVQRQVTLNPKAGTVTTSTAAADRTTEAAALKGVTSQAFFLPPQPLTAGATLLKFNILGSDNFRGITGATFKVPTGGVNLQAGHEYRINVTVDVDHITMTGTITPWGAGGEIKYENYTDSVR